MHLRQKIEAAGILIVITVVVGITIIGNWTRTNLLSDVYAPYVIDVGGIEG